jgi:hypothetical protein
VTLLCLPHPLSQSALCSLQRGRGKDPGTQQQTRKEKLSSCSLLLAAVGFRGGSSCTDDPGQLNYQQEKCLVLLFIDVDRCLCALVCVVL